MERKGGVKSDAQDLGVLFKRERRAPEGDVGVPMELVGV